MKEVLIYTDGACSGNPGPGGYAAVLRYGGHEKEICGSEAYTTNQRMEMKAALAALEILKEPCHVLLHSDSAYLVNAFNQGWLDKWQRNGWQNSRKEPVENRDLWEQLLEAAGAHRVEWVKVRGHADDELNIRCDKLARGALEKK
ncbi:MAG: ribonuclease HI [Dethiobacter sp.]|nr:ribonuclease HI [Dethiobacter sp.]